MTKFKLCAVVLQGDKEVYRRGEQIKGNVVLDVTENITVKGVKIYLRGETLTKWDEFSGRTTKDYIGKEKYVGLVITLFGKKQGQSGPNHTLTAGRHKYAFTFNLPNDDLPSSFEGEYGATRYWLHVEVDKPFPGFNQNWFRCVTVVADIDVNEAKFKAPVKRSSSKTVSKALGFGDAGKLSLSAATDRAAYCAGEKIALNVVCKNETTKDMGKLRAQLFQEVHFTANNENKSRETLLRALEGKPLTKSDVRTWKNQMLEIDAVPPTTKPRSCHIIDVSYFVKVFIEVPWGFNLDVKLPITIGTVPYGHTRSNPQGATPSGVIDATSAITYTKCNKGFQRCRKTEGTFQHLDYTPMCPYVPNYVFKPRTAAAMAQATPKRVMTPKPKVVTNPPPTSAAASKAIEAAGLPPPAVVGPPPSAPFPEPGQDPPSYEDVLNMDNPTATQETPVEEENSDILGGLLILRFPDTRIEEFRNTVEKQSQSLQQKGGRLIALAVQPIGTKEGWPARTSLAIFKFGSEESAADWFNTAPDVSNPDWLGTCDAFVDPLKEQFNESANYFSMSKLKKKESAPKELVTSYTEIAPKLLKPLRMMKGGVLLTAGLKYRMLRGDWLKDPHQMTLTQWESLPKYYEYRATFNSDPKYKDCRDMLTQIYQVSTSVLFQSEDLSPFEETNENAKECDTQSQAQASI